MARQGIGEARRLMLAIDPGDRWTGVASIEVRGTYSIWRSGVLQSDDDYLRPVDMLEFILGFAKSPLLALEDFRTRGVGHQTFNSSKTPRLIGAMEYVAKKNECPVYFIQPGNIKKDLRGFGLDQFFIDQGWEVAQESGRWEHARSAWRIMAHMILRHYPQLHYLFEFEKLNHDQLTQRGLRLDNWTSDRSDKWAGPLILRRLA